MNILKSLYLNSRLFIALGANVLLFALAYFFTPLLPIAQMSLLAVIVFFLFDCFLLYRIKKGMFARRESAARLSNGDNNDITLYIENFYSFTVHVAVIDEVPFQFQVRDLLFTTDIPAGREKILNYTVRPVRRGEYHFGALNIYVSTSLQLVSRRFRFAQDAMLPVYPSYIQMRKYELYAISNRLVKVGIKKIRRVGNTMEFDQIRQYVTGDDYRTLNWKATARSADFMVNQFQDEKSQQVFSVIDMGRVMKMPFEEMSLLDYAINASLVISNIAIRKQDKAGIITFSNTMGAMLPAERKSTQISHILETLYNQQTLFQESDFELLYATVRRKIKQRSLILLYTNFETLSALQRQMPYLRRIARSHLLVVIFFENTELRSLLNKRTETTEEIYFKTIAEKFAFEKKQIVKELEQYGIHTILTAPQNLTVNTINKYLELKARRLI